MEYKYTITKVEETPTENNITITSKGKDYHGKAKLNPEDHYSVFFGDFIAETRAYIKLLKDELKRQKVLYKEIENFTKSLFCYKNFDKESFEAKMIYRQLNIRKKNIDIIKEEIHNSELEIMNRIKAREKVERHLKEKEKGKES